MKKLLSVLAIGLALFLGACNSSGNENHRAPEKSAEDTYYTEVMALHDEAMPKMGALMGHQKTAQSRIDSLNSLGGTANAAAVDRLTRLRDQLAAAEKGMNDWMEGFNPDPEGTEAEKTDYFKAEKDKAQKMRDDIFVALDSAKAVLQ